VLAIAGGKGGSGKTTTALGVAGALAERRRRPLVVDCDLDAPNLHLRAGTPRNPGVDHAADAARNPAEFAHQSDGLPGVDVLAAGDADGSALSTLLSELPHDRPVVLDCPAGASEAAARPLRAADAAVVVATRGRESLEDAVKTAAMARAVDTPVRAAAVTAAASAPESLRGALGAPTVVAVPEVGRPLAADATRAAYGRVADAAVVNSFMGNGSTV
jgi:septum site-determining protein MinD